MDVPARDERLDGWELRASGRGLGAEIEGIDLRRIDDAGFEALHRALLDHLVLLARPDAGR